MLIISFSISVVALSTDDIVKNINLGLDLQGGFEILYQVIPLHEQQVTQALLLHTQAALDKRINIIGISEPNLEVEGHDRIRVQLAGISDQDQARRMLATEAKLSFRDVEDNLLMDGTVLREGAMQVVFHQTTNRPMVSMTFTDPDLVQYITTQLLHQRMVIWLDYEEGDSFRSEQEKERAGGIPKYLSAPVVNHVLSTSGTITSDYWSYAEAKELADLLNAGSLPVQLIELSAQSVGAKLGELAFSKTLIAGIIGAILIVLYMLIYYRLPGVVAVLTLVVYVYLILLVFMLLRATLTLPGIAALVLGIGMAVDANIITFERLKEEMRAGKSIASAYKASSKRSLITILDSNITTMIAASVLFVFGSSAIQGFAVMLITSITVSMLTAVVGSRLLLKLLIGSKHFDHRPGLFGVKREEISEL